VSGQSAPKGTFAFDVEVRESTLVKVTTEMRAGLAIVTSVLILTGCADTGSMAGSPSTGPQAPTGAASTRTSASTIFQNMTVRHPTAWQLVSAERMSSGPSGAVGFLTNQPTHAQCITQGDPTAAYSIACGPPVSSLLPNGVFVGFTGYFTVPHGPSSHNRTLDGHQATVQTVSPREGNCPTGTTDAEQMSIFLPSPDSVPAGSGTTVVMTACYAGPDSTSIAHDIDTLIDSVNFR